jgi:GNAT superfamily N-acetyltransferase
MADVGREAGFAAALTVSDAGEDDVLTLAALHTAVARDLTARYGRGHWSQETTERGVAWALKRAHVLAGRLEGEIIATLQLQKQKPWAIDQAYFTDVARPLYLTSMAVAPGLQRRGIGRALVEHAAELARARPADAIRLDAYDADAGAGPFYAKCGYRQVGRVVYRGTPLIYYELLLCQRERASHS